MNRAIFLSLTAMLALPLPVSAVTIMLPASRDTALNSQSTNVDNGAQLGIGLGGAGGSNDSRLLYHFDLSSFNVPYESIDSITLRLFVSNNQISDASGNPGLDVFVHAISAANADWIEGNKIFTTASAGEPTWSHRQYSTVLWAGSAGLSTSGTDYLSTPLSTTNVPSTAALDSPIDFVFTGDLTGLIDGWQSVNPGLLVFTTIAGDLGAAGKQFPGF